MVRAYQEHLADMIWVKIIKEINCFALELKEAFFLGYYRPSMEETLRRLEKDSGFLSRRVMKLF